MVTFEQHNLATLPRLPVALGGGPIDLIMCRNVMIYLDRAVIARMIDGFHRSLANGSCLVVAPVETSIPGLRRRFEALPSTAGTIYRRPHGGPATRSPAPAPTRRVPAAAARPTARADMRPPPAIVRAQPPSEEALFTSLGRWRTGAG